MYTVYIIYSLCNIINIKIVVTRIQSSYINMACETCAFLPEVGFVATTLTVNVGVMFPSTLPDRVTCPPFRVIVKLPEKGVSVISV